MGGISQASLHGLPALAVTRKGGSLKFVTERLQPALWCLGLLTRVRNMHSPAIFAMFAILLDENK